ncbi:hypothetical protein B9G69_003215 [Bdellovibrio sp. SKB1291214]|uniref:hypothetical protein n=1 Tax=Bdellovibrio sp. SKB1291214 TaxID=1732569 RepID=UPI000B51890F|nr:hypothetical protein [Bdellovibrio sp. SKB1291214]UYL09581.1 hypothetical protein B9G69_003215 [Bdellovibrio sp. SKB1291214]
MKILAIGLMFFGMASGAGAAGLNCKNEAAAHALEQMVEEVIGAGRNISEYKFNVQRPVTEDVIDLSNGDVKEIYLVAINVYKGRASEDIELPFVRTVQVEILNTKAGKCRLLKTHRSDGE